MVFCQQFGANSSYIVGGYFLFALGPFGYTCRSLKTPDGQAEDIAKSVAAGVAKWAESKQEITTDDMTRKTTS
jgi:hypothetical protein